MVTFSIDDSLSQHPEMFSDSYLPDSIVGREHQLQELRHCLAPAMQRKKPIHTWLYGSPGTGKTLVARYGLREIRESSPRVCGAYVNDWENNTWYSVICHLVKEFRILFAEKPDAPYKLSRLRHCLHGRPCIIVLDEIDKMPPVEANATVYNLASMDNVGLVCIACSLSGLHRLDERVKSRLGIQPIEFRPYEIEDLAAIQKQRAELGLEEMHIDNNIMVKIAGLSQGDARIAIQTLRKCAELAKVARDKEITEEHLSEAASAVSNMRLNFLLDRMTKHQRLLYSIIDKAGEICSGELWRNYLDRCKHQGRSPIAGRTFSLYLSRLIESGLVTADRALGKGNSRMFQVAGHARNPVQNGMQDSVANVSSSADMKEKGLPRSLDHE